MTKDELIRRFETLVGLELWYESSSPAFPDGKVDKWAVRSPNGITICHIGIIGKDDDWRVHAMPSGLFPSIQKVIIDLHNSDEGDK